MRFSVYTIDGKRTGHIDLARLFSIPIRDDVIKKAVLAERAAARQPYGRDELAGKRTSAHYHGLRHYRWTMMNREMARMKRIHHQGYLEWTARFVPQAVKGRLAHPPLVEKVWKQKINKKERILALLSAASATAIPQLVKNRGHKLENVQLPIIVEDDIEAIKKAKELEAFLKKIGLEHEIERIRKTKQRAGKGKRRGRRIIKRKGPLIVIKKDRGIGLISSIPGIDIVNAEKLTVSHLAPGTTPGRLCIWSKGACEFIDKLGEKIGG
ncbi:MAG: 50S ribosomal protein L4 [Candidatus Aenigmatarchaeota archaeon]